MDLYASSLCCSKVNMYGCVSIYTHTHLYIYTYIYMYIVASVVSDSLQPYGP